MPSIATKEEPLTRIKVISGTKKYSSFNSHRRSTIISKPTGYYRPVGYICKSFVFTFNLDIMKKNYPLLSICLLALPFQGYAQKRQMRRSPIYFYMCRWPSPWIRSLWVCCKNPEHRPAGITRQFIFQHYVQVPTSGASRASMLTGHFPKDKSDLSNEACRTRLSDKPEGEIPETMFHHLRRNGYYTVGIGKISHYVDGCLYGYEAPKTENRNYLIVGMKCFSMPENGETVGMPFSDMQMEVTGKVAKTSETIRMCGCRRWRLSGRANGKSGSQKAKRANS